MAETKIIKAVFGAVKSIITQPRYRYDYGQILEVSGITLPESFEARFSNAPTGESVRVLGQNQRVAVPDELLRTGKSVWCYITVHDAVTDGRTMYTIRIPIKDATERTDAEPTPVQQDIITQAIAALNSAVEQTGQDVIDADASAQAAQDAQTAAESARDMAIQAETSASASAATATTASQNAISSATVASQSAITAENASESASASADASAQSALRASQFAVDASVRAHNASEYAQTASGYASNASASAQTASQKASEAAQSASTAVQAKTDAETAKTASETAQGLAESARDTAVSAKDDAESARDDAVQAKEDAESAVASISGALIDKAPVITDTASGSIASFTDGADDLPLKSLIVDINPVQDLHGQDAPYPAGGGVNKFKYNASVGTQIINGVTWTLYEDGSIQVSGTASGASTFRYVLPERVEDDDFYFSGNYKFYAFPANISTANFQGGVKIGSKWYSVYADGYSSALNDADGKIVEAWFQVRADKTINATIRPMIYPESESTPTAWSPYENICPISGWTEIDVNHSDADMTNPTTLTINLGQTVYGGKLDVTTGVLTVTDAQIASYAGETLPGEWISDRDVYVAGTTPTTGAQVVYKLATPITYTLTPTEIRSLLGTNNVFADTGDSTVEYRADTTMYINRKIAEAVSALS